MKLSHGDVDPKHHTLRQLLEAKARFAHHPDLASKRDQALLDELAALRAQASGARESYDTRRAEAAFMVSSPQGTDRKCTKVPLALQQVVMPPPQQLRPRGQPPRPPPTATAHSDSDG